MKRIGIRELRQEASKHLRDVARGETIEITDRGRPVARIVPLPPETTFEALVASGRVTPPRGDLLEFLERHPPLPAIPGLRTASDELAQMREHER